MIDLVLTHDGEEDLLSFLADKGVGNPPMSLLLCVEKGLRAFATDKFAMGTHAFESEEKYYAIAIWRKREAYIAVCRYLLGVTKGYLKYVQYDWSDYQMRHDLQKTFDLRHAPYTNGTKRLAGLPPAAHWSCTATRSSKKVAATSSAVVGVAAAEVGDKYEYDSEEETWVKVVQ